MNNLFAINEGETLPFIDIKLVEKVDERVNFIVKCENEEELEELKQMIKSNKKMILFSEFKKHYENTTS